MEGIRHRVNRWYSEFENLTCLLICLYRPSPFFFFHPKKQNKNMSGDSSLPYKVTTDSHPLAIHAESHHLDNVFSISSSILFDVNIWRVFTIDRLYRLDEMARKEKNERDRKHWRCLSFESGPSSITFHTVGSLPRSVRHRWRRHHHRWSILSLCSNRGDGI